MADGDRINKYMHTPRRLFDKAIDRMELKRKRDKEDHRADSHLMMSKITLLTQRLHQLEQHVRSHCNTLGEDDNEDYIDPSSTEGLE